MDCTRVNLYLTRISGTGFVSASLLWTDNGGSVSEPNQIQAPGPATASHVVFAKSGTPIRVSATISGSPVFDLIASVESL